MKRKRESKWKRREALEQCIERAIFQRAGRMARYETEAVRARLVANVAVEIKGMIADELLREYRVIRRARHGEVVG